MKVNNVPIIDLPSQTRKRILNLDLKDEIFFESLQEISKKIKCKVSSVFLFSKDGLLKREIIYSDMLKDVEDENWFLNESYKIGQSFVGRVLDPQSHYGRANLFTEIQKSDLQEYSKYKYLGETLEIHSIISIPLNGKNQTYGVLEVITDKKFTGENLAWLSAITSYLATSYSNYRRANQAKIINKLVASFLDFDSTDIHADKKAKSIYQEVANKLVESSTSFKICIIRIFNEETNQLDIIAKSESEEGLLQGRINDPISPIQGKALVWEVFNKGNFIVMNDIDKKINNFINREWITERKFESFACFPLKTNKQTYGTLSVYVQYKYDFHKSCIDFLEEVSSKLSLFEGGKKQNYRVNNYRINNLNNLLSHSRYNNKLNNKLSLGKDINLHIDLLGDIDKVLSSFKLHSKRSYPELVMDTLLSEERLNTVISLLKEENKIKSIDSELEEKDFILNNQSIKLHNIVHNIKLWTTKNFTK